MQRVVVDMERRVFIASIMGMITGVYFGSIVGMGGGV
jgi:hypothetical protein